MDAIGTKTLALAVRDQNFLAYLLRNGVRVDEFWSDPVDQWIAKLVLPLGERYGVVTQDMLVSAVTDAAAKAPKHVRAAWPVYTARVMSVLTESYPDLDWIRDNAERQIKARMYDALLRASVPLNEAGDYEAIIKLWEEAQARANLSTVAGGGENIKDGLKWFRPFMQDVKSGKFKGVSTGIPVLDNALFWKGMGVGELTLIIGNAKGGKTMAMLWFGYVALRDGLNVVYLTLEVGKRIVYHRMACCHLRMHQDDFLVNLDPAMDEFEEWLTNPKRGNFTVYDLPRDGADSADIEEIIKVETTGGRKPTLFIVDYAKLMYHPQKKTNPVLALGENVEALHGLSKTYGLCMVTGAQLNREGDTKPMARLSHIGYDYSQIQTADTNIILGQRPNSVPLDPSGNPLPFDMDIKIAPSRNESENTLTISTAYHMGRFYNGPVV